MRVQRFGLRPGDEVARARDLVRAVVVRERDRHPRRELARDHAILGAVEDQRRDRVDLHQHRSLGHLPLAVAHLVHRDRGAQRGRTRERLAVIGDLLRGERPLRRPATLSVHGADVRAPLLGRGELGEQAVRVAALAHEVVHLGALVRRRILGNPRLRERRDERRRERVEQALALDEARQAQPELGDHDRADIARDRAAALDAERRAQRAQVARVRGRIAEAVRGQGRTVPHAAQVGDDHVEARRRERRDIARPDPLRLREAVHEQERSAALPRAPVADFEIIAHLAAVHRKTRMPRRFHRGSLFSRATARLVACTIALVLAVPAAATYYETIYARVLERHTRPVSDLARVRVDYPAIAGSLDWRRLVASLASADLAALRSREEQIAFWVNTYNILAIDLVATHYPVASIRDIGSIWRSVWKQSAGTVGGRAMTLDEIEHGIIRPFGDPRTHAVVVCASSSCPALPREPLTAARLDAQLDAAVRQWLADPGKGMRIDRAANTVYLSRIF